jgi:hypothetical protein
MTTGQLLLTLQQACYRSPLVDRVDVQAIDADTLSVRIYLTCVGTFVGVFYNLATAKTAFALVEDEKRIYGVDNAKMRWHQHPFSDPVQHIPCGPVQFEDFLAEVETHYCKSSVEQEFPSRT